MKNIDKIFNESLQHYERQPRTEAWEKLQVRLEKKDSKVLPLWWKYASAASIALLLGVGGYWFSSQKETQIEVANVSNKPILKKEVEERKSNEVRKIETAKVDESSLSPMAGVNLNAQFSPHVRKHSSDVVSPVARVPINPAVRKQISSVAGVPTSPHVRKHTQVLTTNINPVNSSQIRKQTQELQNQNNSIIALETVKTKTELQENTIVLVLENAKPKKEEETIVLNFVETKQEVIAQNIEPEKKQSRVGKIWEQLKRAKNGENVNWGEVGVKPQKVLARADAKIENALTRGESNDR